MVVMTKTYTDFDGNERTEDFMFNYTAAEIADMEWSTEGGLAALITKITNEKNNKELVKLWKEILLGSYGVKSPDGKKFIKNEELVNDFKASAAYSDIYMELSTDAKKAADFINAVMPKNIPGVTDENPKDGNKAPVIDMKPTN